MRIISDNRRLRVLRLRCVSGEMVSEQGSDIWQNPDGEITCSGNWEGLIAPAREDLEMIATGMNLSPLEFLRMRLLSCASVQVEVI